MKISLVNFTKIPDGNVLRVSRAINRQVREDFAPYWHWSADLRLEGRSPLNETDLGAAMQELKQSPQDLRGDAIVYLWDRVADVGDALGYHDQNNRGLPYGFVFTELSRRLDEPWSVSLSHEVLEMIADANANTLAAGPHPCEPDRLVFHWYEVCDAVQTETYLVDGIRVSNFVLPLYFTLGEQVGGRNDYLNRTRRGAGLRSFGVNPGGYIGFYDPKLQQHDTYTADARAERRMEVKAGLGRARRSRQYRDLVGHPGKSERLMREREVQLPRHEVRVSTPPVPLASLARRGSKRGGRKTRR